MRSVWAYDGDGGFGGWDGEAGLAVELAAELAGDGCALQGQLVGGARGCGEVQLDGVADVVDSEVADGFGEAEGWGAGWAGAGAADCGQNCSKSGTADEQGGRAPVAAVRHGHGNEPSILRCAYFKKEAFLLVVQISSG